MFLYNACDNSKSQSICAHSQLARGYESDLIMLLHYYLMPWTLLENRFAIACSHIVFIMIWHAVMPTEIQRPVAIYTWFLGNNRWFDDEDRMVFTLFRHLHQKLWSLLLIHNVTLVIAIKYASANPFTTLFCVLTVMWCLGRRMWKLVMLFFFLWCNIFVLSHRPGLL